MHYDPTEALERIDNDTGLLAMLITVFVKERPNYINRLLSACDAKDLNTLGDAAHNVKGASAAIGFEACTSLAEALEVACRQSGVKSIAYYESSTTQLVELLAQCEPVLKNWVNQA